MQKDAVTSLSVDYQPEHINLDHSLASINFNVSIQFDELPKPIEEMTFQELHDFSGQKLYKKLKCYLN